MADCECLEKCPFFNDRMQNMPALSKVYKRNYCQSDSAKCARFVVFKALGREAVPDDLFPNQMEVAEELINKSS